jgi:hypothetical protein
MLHHLDYLHRKKAFIIATKSPRPAHYGPLKGDEIEREPGIEPKEALATVVLGPEKALATVVPGTTNVPAKGRGTVNSAGIAVWGTTNVPAKGRGTLNSVGIAGWGTANTAAKAPGIPGYMLVVTVTPGAVKAPGIPGGARIAGRGKAVEPKLEKLTGSSENGKVFYQFILVRFVGPFLACCLLPFLACCLLKQNTMTSFY